MKEVFIKLLAVLIVCLTIVFCCCKQESQVEEPQVEASVFPKESMFVVVETSITWKIVYHKETKVMYAVSYYRNNCGSFTLLVDEHGMPLLWQGE